MEEDTNLNQTNILIQNMELLTALATQLNKIVEKIEKKEFNDNEIGLFLHLVHMAYDIGRNHK